MAGTAKKKEEKLQHSKAQKLTTKEAIPELRPGMTVRIHQKISEKGPKGDKERIQIFEGMILAHRRGMEPGATITVRKISDGIGVEKIFPIHSPNVLRIEPVKQAKVHRAKLFYLRSSKKRLQETPIQ